jgi:hypothetical protein
LELKETRNQDFVKKRTNYISTTTIPIIGRPANQPSEGPHRGRPAEQAGRHGPNYIHIQHCLTSCSIARADRGKLESLFTSLII